MSHQQIGTVKNILPKEEGVSKNGKSWEKQSFILDTGDQYNPDLCITAFGETKVKIIEQLSNGDEIEAFFNLHSKEFNGKYYHNVDLWKVEVLSSNKQVVSEDNQGDDLPF